jgi:NAD(P)-dependent dehydrogenase (short-subunit alcohol dehydrogenase family)
VRENALDDALATFKGDTSRCVPLVMNVADPDSIMAGVGKARQAFGGIDGLVNNAGIFRSFATLDTTWKDWHEMFDVNVFGAFEVARLVARTMIDDGIKGAIVSLASEAGKKGYADSIAYSASKAAVISFTRTLAIGLAPHDINVNCVCPCGTDTPMLRQVAVYLAGKTGNEDVDQVYGGLVSSQFQRHIQPIELARVISFLLSDAAVLIRGQAVNTDGGDTPY